MTDTTKHLLSSPTNAQRLQVSIEELNNGGGVEVDPAMFDTVDTSKEAVVYDPELHADKFDPSAGEYMVFWESHVALLAERDQLRREVEEARSVRGAANVLLAGIDEWWSKGIAIASENARENANRGKHKWPTVCREGVRAAIQALKSRP